MKKIIYLLTLIPVISFCQVNKHNVFGIDLNLDWYSLTDYSAITYSFINQDNKDAPYVITDFKYYNDKIYKDFIDIGFSELLLGFPKNKSNVHGVTPEILIARINYKDINDYKLNSNKNITKILSLLKRKFGDAELNMVKEKSSLYKWNGESYETFLSSVENDLQTTYIYTKK